MIPTVRSMIVTTLLTLMALVGGFGLFAAFRVNHGPLARLPASATPFALADNNAPLQALGFASDATFGSRLENDLAVMAVDTATLDAKSNDDSRSVSSAAANPQAYRALPQAAVAELEPEGDGATLPPVAASEVDAKTGNSEPPQLETAATSAPQTAAVEAPSDQEASYPTNVQAASAAPALENGQVQSPPNLASPATPAAAVTAAITPDALATTPADAQDAAKEAARESAREAARRRRLAAARRARRALLAAAYANQISLFPQANDPTAQQAVGGPFVPAPAPARTRRQN